MATWTPRVCVFLLLKPFKSEDSQKLGQPELTLNLLNWFTSYLEIIWLPTQGILPAALQGMFDWETHTDPKYQRFCPSYSQSRSTSFFSWLCCSSATVDTSGTHVLGTCNWTQDLVFFFNFLWPSIWKNRVTQLVGSALDGLIWFNLCRLKGLGLTESRG